MLFNSGRLIFCSLLLLKIPRRISWGFVFHWKRSRRAANRLKIGASRLTLIVGKGDFAFQQSRFSVEDCRNCKNMSSVKIWELPDFSNSSFLTLILFIFHSFLKFGWISWVIFFSYGLKLSNDFCWHPHPSAFWKVFVQVFKIYTNVWQNLSGLIPKFSELCQNLPIIQDTFLPFWISSILIINLWTFNLPQNFDQRLSFRNSRFSQLLGGLRRKEEIAAPS